MVVTLGFVVVSVSNSAFSLLVLYMRHNSSISCENTDFKGTRYLLVKNFI